MAKTRNSNGSKVNRFIAVIIIPLVTMLLLTALPIGLLSSAMAESQPGVNWTVRESGTTETLYGVTWGGDKFVAVGMNGTILTSSDGVTWIKQNSNTVNQLYDVTWANNQFVAVGGSGGILTSPDGIAWTRHNVLPEASKFMYDSYIFNPDGISNPITGITWGNNKFVAVGSPYYGSDLFWGTIANSSDGINWTEIDDFPDGIEQCFLDDVIWNGSIFVAVGGLWYTESEGNYVFTSPDGSNWTKRNLGTTAGLGGIAWDGNQFVAVGQTIVTSPDGINWTERSSGLDESRGYLTDITWNGSQFVAVGNGGPIFTSPNGVVWTEQVSGTSSNLNSIAWNGNKFVVVGVDGMILNSSYREAGPDQLGDINLDGRIDVLDVTLTMQHSLGLKLLSETQRTAADVNGDKIINVLDVTLLLKHSLGLIDSFQ